jgi:hypothetical protein
MAFIGRKPTNAPLTSSDLGTGIVGSTNIADGTIVNDDINANAAIASSKLSITSPLSITGNATAGSEIRLPEDTDNGSNYVALKAANSIASNVTFTLPDADGSANQALVTNGSGVLSFAAVGASAGQVIQVLSATDSTERSSASNSFVTGSNTLSVTITPSSASNKILIIVDVSAQPGGSGGQYRGTIFRGNTNLGEADDGMAFMSTGISGAGGCHIYDSPNTTSATTYQFYFRATQANETVYINLSGAKSSLTCLEVKG